MTVNHTFEIKVALLGNVSAGKTTVLNALFRDKFGEVSMKRTTAGVNFFQISRKLPKDNNETSNSDQASLAWSMISDSPRSAKSTHDEIANDNKTLRASETVSEKTFDIELDEDLVEMRQDTKLTIIDIPGINEANASHKYKDYVIEKWNSFDCIVAVMDGRQGVNTEEQVDLLRFLKTNLMKQKTLPVIILCNKVDEPEDEEQLELVREAQQEVEKVFDVSDRTEMLQWVLRSNGEVLEPDAMLQKQVYPIFIPISAINAFVYQSASRMTLKQFSTYFDKAFIEKLGRDQVGRKRWKKLSEKEKLQEVYNVVSCPEENQEGIEDANFDKFLKALVFSCGGKGLQRQLIIAQMEVAIEALSTDKCIAAQVTSIFQKKRALEDRDQMVVEVLQDVTLQDAFWRKYQKCENAAFERFTTPENASCLSRPFEELMAYHDMIVDAGWTEEEASISFHMKALVRRQFGILFDNEQVSPRKAKGSCVGTIKSWETLTYTEWENVFSSISLLSYDKVFCEHFGREKIFMDKLSREAAILQGQYRCRDCGALMSDDEGHGSLYCRGCKIHFFSSSKSRTTFAHTCPKNGEMSVSMRSVCPYCKDRFERVDEFPVLSGGYLLRNSYKNGSLEPVDAAKYKLLSRLDIPESLNDKNHFGHLAWRYCQFMHSLSSAAVPR